MKILITGINGFVGKILHDRLKREYEYIYGIDYNYINDEKFNFSVDITDYNKLENCIEQIKPDFIFHLAAISRVDLNDKRKIYEVNTLGTLNLLNACLNLNIKPKILFTSSSQVYGNVANKSIYEEEKINPVNHYGASKAAAENILKAFSVEGELPIVICRSFNHTGKGQPENFIISKFANAFKRKDKYLEVGNLEVIRDFMDVRDTVEAYISLMKNFKSGEIYNVSSGKGLKLSDVVKELEKITGHRIILNENKAFIRDNEVMEMIGSHDKLIKYSSWKPKYSITDTLKWMLSD